MPLKDLHNNERELIPPGKKHEWQRHLGTRNRKTKQVADFKTESGRAEAGKRKTRIEKKGQNIQSVWFIAGK